MAIRQKKFLFLVLLLQISLIGCSTLDRSQCENMDWKKLGQIDSEHGKPENYYLNHQEACTESAAQLDLPAYKVGYQEGLKTYCQKEVAFEEGKLGKTYYGICPAESATEFEEFYKSGRKAFLLKKELDATRDQIAEERKRSSEDNSVVGDIAKVVNLLNGTSPTQGLENQESKIQRELTEAESQAPPITIQTRSSQDLNRGIIAGAGAMLGTVFGFGVGHVVQSRYLETGWKWTVADGAALTALIVSSQSCNNTRTPTGNYRSECKSILPMLSMLSLLGFRVWQSVDLWKHTTRVVNGYHNVSQVNIGISNLQTAQEINLPGLLVSYSW